MRPSYGAFQCSFDGYDDKGYANGCANDSQYWEHLFGHYLAGFCYTAYGLNVVDGLQTFSPEIAGPATQPLRQTTTSQQSTHTIVRRRLLNAPTLPRSR